MSQCLNWQHHRLHRCLQHHCRRRSPVLFWMSMVYRRMTLIQSGSHRKQSTQTTLESHTNLPFAALQSGRKMGLRYALDSQLVLPTETRLNAQVRLEQWMPHQDEYLRELLHHEGRGGRSNRCNCDGMPSQNSCLSKAPGTYRCRDCTGGRMLCKQCTLDMHAGLPLHRIQVFFYYWLILH